VTGDSKMNENELPRKERERLEHRRLILETAMKLFAEKGFHDVSMNEIALKAEFAVGTLYKFFSSKEELYIIMLKEKALEHFNILSQNLVHDDDIITILKKHLEKGAKFIADNFSIIRVYLSEIKGMSYNLKDGFDRELCDIRKKIIGLVSKIIERGIQQKIFRQIDPYDASIALHGILDAFLFEWIENPDKYSGNIDTNLIIDLFMRGISNDETKNK
jgi:TetR/AcrR family transcriptional regulator